MTDQNHTAAELNERLLESFLRLGVEVIGHLIQNEKVIGCQQQPAQLDLGLFAAAQCL